jgi:hypothetical protein
MLIASRKQSLLASLYSLQDHFLFPWILLYSIGRETRDAGKLLAGTGLE